MSHTIRYICFRPGSSNIKYKYRLFRNCRKHKINYSFFFDRTRYFIQADSNFDIPILQSFIDSLDHYNAIYSECLVDSNIIDYDGFYFYIVEIP